MFNSKGVIPISPKVIPLSVFTFRDFFIMLTLSKIFKNNCCDMHKDVAPVSNRGVIGSILRHLTAKFNNFNFAYVGLDMV